MDIDSTIHSKKVTYIKRPLADNRLSGVRPLRQLAQFNEPRKLQRINHIEQSQHEPPSDTGNETDIFETSREDEDEYKS